MEIVNLEKIDIVVDANNFLEIENSDKTEEKSHILENRIFSILNTVRTIKSKELNLYLNEPENIKQDEEVLIKYINMNIELSKKNISEINPYENATEDLDSKNILNAKFQFINKQGKILAESDFINFENNFPKNIINSKNVGQKNQMIDSDSFLKLMNICFLKILYIEVAIISYFNYAISMLKMKIGRKFLF